jgi:hypothetical protein
MGFVILCPTCPVMFTRKEEDAIPIRLIVYIDYCAAYNLLSLLLQEKQSRNNVLTSYSIQGLLSRWYLAARLHKDKDFNITMDQSICIKSIICSDNIPGSSTLCIINESNTLHGCILPTSFMITSKDILATMTEDFSQMQEAYVQLEVVLV